MSSSDKLSPASKQVVVTFDPLKIKEIAFYDHYGKPIGMNVDIARDNFEHEDVGLIATVVASQDTSGSVSYGTYGELDVRSVFDKGVQQIVYYIRHVPTGLHFHYAYFVRAYACKVAERMDSQGVDTRCLVCNFGKQYKAISVRDQDDVK